MILDHFNDCLYLGDTEDKNSGIIFTTTESDSIRIILYPFSFLDGTTVPSFEDFAITNELSRSSCYDSFLSGAFQ